MRSEGPGPPRRLQSLLALLLLASAVLPGHADDALPAQAAPLGEALLERATRLLERYGTTFYALGAYIDTAGRLREIVPRDTAPLDPERIAWSLRDALRDPDHPEWVASAIATDRPERGATRIVYEMRDGRCHEVLRRYRFSDDGTVRFAKDASPRPCASAAQALATGSAARPGFPAFAGVEAELDGLLCPCALHAVREGEPRSGYGSGPRLLVIAHNATPPYALLNLGQGTRAAPSTRADRYRCVTGRSWRPAWSLDDGVVEAFLTVVGQGAEACWFDGRLEARMPGAQIMARVRGACGC